MSETVRLVIVTDQPDIAAKKLLACQASRLPGWIKVMTGTEISTLPEGSPVLAVFFGSTSLAETLFHERRRSTKLDDDYDKHVKKLDAWYRGEVERERNLCREAGATFPDDIPQVSAREMENLHLCRPAPSHPPQSASPKQSKWR